MGTRAFRSVAARALRLGAATLAIGLLAGFAVELLGALAIASLHAPLHAALHGSPFAGGARAQTLALTLGGELEGDLGGDLGGDLEGDLGGGPGGGVAPAGVALALEDLRAGDTDAAFALRLAPRAAAPPLLSTELTLRQNASLGPLGGGVLALGGALRSDGLARLELRGEGSAGPAALRLRATAFNAPVRAFGPDALLASGGLPPPAPEFAPGLAGASLALGVSYRASRDLVLGVDPLLLWLDGAWGARLQADARWRRALDGNDLEAALLLYLPPQPRGAAGADGAAALQPRHPSAALGATLVLVRRRAPDWRLSGWLGWAGGPLPRVAPGAALAGAEPLPGGGRLELHLAAEPFRRDAPPYRLRVALERPLAPGSWTLAGGLELDEHADLRASASLRYRLPLPRAGD